MSSSILQVPKLHVEIVKVKFSEGNIKSLLSKLSARCKNTFLQLINEESYYSKSQVTLAYVLTQKAFKEGYNRLKKPPLEFLLYLSATTQFNKAIEKVGIGEKNVACLIIISDDRAATTKCLNSIRSEVEVLGECTPGEEYIKKLYEIDDRMLEEQCFQRERRKCLEVLVLESISSIDYV